MGFQWNHGGDSQTEKISMVQVKHEEKWNEGVAHLPEAHENSRNGFVSRIVAEIERLG